MARKPLIELEKTSYALVKWPRKQGVRAPQKTVSLPREAAEPVAVLGKGSQRSGDTVVEESSETREKLASAQELLMGDIVAVTPPERLKGDPVFHPFASHCHQWYGVVIANRTKHDSVQIFRCVEESILHNGNREEDFVRIARQNCVLLARSDITARNVISTKDRDNLPCMKEGIILYVDITDVLTIPGLHLSERKWNRLQLSRECSLLLRDFYTQHTPPQSLEALLRDVISTPYFRESQYTKSSTYWSLELTFGTYAKAMASAKNRSRLNSESAPNVNSAVPESPASEPSGALQWLRNKIPSASTIQTMFTALPNISDTDQQHSPIVCVEYMNELQDLISRWQSWGPKAAPLVKQLEVANQMAVKLSLGEELKWINTWTSKQ